MKFFVLIAGIMLSLISPAQEKSISLLAGKQLENWYAFQPGIGKQADATVVFQNENGMIRLSGKKPGYLMSLQSFQEFSLKAEYRWNPDSLNLAGGRKKNSGLMYLVPEETPDTLWPKGIQFQIKEGATGDFVLLQEVTLEVGGQIVQPGKSVVVKRSADAEKPFGEWNQIEVECRNGQIVQKLNGITVNEGRNATVTKGRILLQYEGYPIDFKNIEISY